MLSKLPVLRSLRLYVSSLSYFCPTFIVFRSLLEADTEMSARASDDGNRTVYFVAFTINRIVHITA